jgi:pimeloyl-ACP methyl ester carboxylesterase
MHYCSMADTTHQPNRTRFLDRPGGRIAFDVVGDGRLLVLTPGMGDLRATYRFLAPQLVTAGYRVATLDLRGHGDSDPGFETYGDLETGSDIAALVESLGGPAVVIGNSMGAGAAVCAAAERPELISGLVLVGPFVRDGETNVVTRALLRVAMMTPWAAASWRSYLPRLYAGRTPEDHDAYLSRVVASLRRPGYTRAFSRTTRITHNPAETRLKQVQAPSLVIMGERDPDFPDPQAEATWIADTLGGQVVMVPDSGHYPQSQQPDLVAAAIRDFLSEMSHRG